MRHGWRKRALPAVDEQGEPSYADLCWLLPHADGDGVVLAEMIIMTGRLVVRGKSVTHEYPGDQELRRLAQIDWVASDVQLLFVDAANVLDLTRLRFATATKAQTFRQPAR